VVFFILKISGLLNARSLVTTHKALNYFTTHVIPGMQNHWPLHKMSITPNIVMICIDMQGEEHHCQEEQEIQEFLPTKITIQ
jgi:hypothetical protein